MVKKTTYLDENILDSRLCHFIHIYIYIYIIEIYIYIYIYIFISIYICISTDTCFYIYLHDSQKELKHFRLEILVIHEILRYIVLNIFKFRF